MPVYPVPSDISITKGKIKMEKTKLWLNIETNQLIKGSTFLSEEIFSTMKAKYGYRQTQNKHKQFDINTTSGEDGYLRDIFKEIGDKTKFCVDIGARGTFLSNTKYISEQRNWVRILFDIQAAVGVIKVKVTPDNVNELLKENGCPEEPDLISIDIDSADYWVWKAIKYPARVVIIEVNSHLPFNIPVVTPLNASYSIASGAYFGTSSMAMQILARSKGYSLVQKTPSNAIYVRDDLIDKLDKLDWPNINNMEKLFIPPDKSWL